jgi:hypothetical protein
MIIYVPTSNNSVAQQLSEALWSLTRPPQVRQSNEVTTEMFCSVNCADASAWMQVDTEFSIPVHAEAILNGIAGIMQPYIDEGYLPVNTNAQLSALIESKRGQQLVIYDAFPTLFKLHDTVTNPNGLGKTSEQMIAAGLLAETSI